MLALVCGLSPVAWADDFPNGALAVGVVTQVATFGPWLRFIVNGAMDNGSNGTQAFWIDCTATGASARIANVLAAAAQGKTVSIWNYGTLYSYGGQSGYLSSIEFVNY